MTDRWLSTHVLDTSRGRPAAGVAVRLVRLAPDGPAPVAEATTNADGRTDEPLLADAALASGTYEATFALGAYFAGLGVGADPDGHRFLDEVPVRFAIGDADRHVHLALLATPWSYTTYKGS